MATTDATRTRRTNKKKGSVSAAGSDTSTRAVRRRIGILRTMWGSGKPFLVSSRADGTSMAHDTDDATVSAFCVRLLATQTGTRIARWKRQKEMQQQQKK